MDHCAKVGANRPTRSAAMAYGNFRIKPLISGSQSGFCFFTRETARMVRMSCKLVWSFVELSWTPKKILGPIPRGVWDLCDSMGPVLWWLSDSWIRLAFGYILLPRLQSCMCGCMVGSGGRLCQCLVAMGKEQTHPHTPVGLLSEAECPGLGCVFWIQLRLVSKMPGWWRSIFAKFRSCGRSGSWRRRRDALCWRLAVC